MYDSLTHLAESHVTKGSNKIEHAAFMLVGLALERRGYVFHEDFYGSLPSSLSVHEFLEDPPGKKKWTQSAYFKLAFGISSV